MSMVPARVAQLVEMRADRNSCEVMTRVCTGRAEHKHHRKLRSRGGKHHAANLLFCCLRCHDHIHGNVAVAERFGWMLRSWQDPCESPVWRVQRWVLLDDLGGFRPCARDGAE